MAAASLVPHLLGALVAARAHLECLLVGDAARAARCAFWLALGLLLRGDVAPGGG